MKSYQEALESYMEKEEFLFEKLKELKWTVESLAPLPDSIYFINVIIFICVQYLLRTWLQLIDFSIKYFHILKIYFEAFLMRA